jgi:CheY-like chemotaxis protein
MPGDQKRRIRLVHWKAEEVPERAARLEAEGYEVDAEVPGTSIGVRQLREDPPSGFVIDLGRLPSHGLEVARALRESKALRRIPIVFVDGAEEKVASIREQLPDATYTVWDDVGAQLRHAIEHPPADPVVPVSRSGPQSGRPLAEKLGVKPGMTIALIDPPAEGFAKALAPLPDGVVLRQGNRGRRADMAIWFTTSALRMERRFSSVAKAVGEGTLWVAWPKRSSGVSTDLSEDEIRRVALDRGMVDTKVCAIDETWSGLRLTKRRTN